MYIFIYEVHIDVYVYIYVCMRIDMRDISVSEFIDMCLFK